MGEGLAEFVPDLRDLVPRPIHVDHYFLELVVPHSMQLKFHLL